MKVGIISKPDHCKAHILELVKHGHDPVCLGASPATVPDSIQLIVCRIASCSHQGSEIAFALKREGREVLFEDGVKAMLDHIQTLEKPVNITPKEGTLPVNETVAETIEAAMKACGVFCSRLYNLTATQAVDLLVQHRFVQGQAAREAARLAIEKVQRRDYSSIRRLCKTHMSTRSGKTGNLWHAIPGWVKHPASGDPPVYVEEPMLSLVALTPERVREFREALSVLAELPRNATRAPPRSSSTPPTTPPEKAAPPEKTPPVAATPAPAAAPPAPLASAPAPLPKPAVTTDPVDHLKEAARLLLDEMRKLGFETITLNKTGALTFERVVVQHGDMSL